MPGFFLTHILGRPAGAMTHGRHLFLQSQKAPQIRPKKLETVKAGSGRNFFCIQS
jgi:hypothetical protein